MSQYVQLLDQYTKSLTLVIASGLNMEIVREAQRHLRYFGMLKAKAQEKIPGLQRSLSEKEEEHEEWLKKVTACPSGIIQVVEAMQNREKNGHDDDRPEIQREISKLRKEIAGYRENMQETPSILAAQRLIRQFEKFEENIQLPLEFGLLQKQYGDAQKAEKEAGTWVNPNLYDHF